MKKVLALLLSSLMVLSLVSCGGNSAANSGSDSGSAEDEKALVVYITEGATSRFSNWMVQNMEEIVARDYPHFELRILDGACDTAVHAEQMENAISMNPDCIIFNQNDSYVLAPQQQAAYDAGIPVINCQNPMYDENGDIMGPYVYADMSEVGKMVAEYAVDMIPEGAQACVLLGPANNMHSGLRHAGWEEVLATRPDIKILDTQIGNWNTDEGMRIAEDWYQAYPELSVIISMNDNMALGAIEAAKAVNREVLAFGVDGMVDACYSVKNGELNATVLQDARLLAAGALELADRAIKGEELTADDFIQCPSALITPENVDEYIAIHEAAG